jgi:hypothetical protein
MNFDGFVYGPITAAPRLGKFSGLSNTRSSQSTEASQ